VLLLADGCPEAYVAWSAIKRTLLLRDTANITAANRMTRPTRLRRLLGVRPEGVADLTRRDRRFTERQRQILRLLAADKLDKEIAAELGLSYRTIRSHVERMFRMCAVRGRAGLVAVWLGHVPFDE
jgi:DNA-binding CsgD family transcriptional regulator